MTNLFEKFEAAKLNLTRLKNEPSNDSKLKLYGLFKQASVGKCNTAKPSMVDFVGRAKWNAWNDLKDMPKPIAQEKYIDYVNELIKSENPEFNSQKIDKYEEIQTSIESNVYKIIFNRSQKFNAFNKKMYEEVIDALNEADKNPDVKLCCITGNGRFFSSGNDLGNYTLNDQSDDVQSLIDSGCKLVEKFVSSFITFSKPLVALVNGPAIGISFTILGIFDLIIASDKAYFTAPFTQIALSPEGCSSYTFPRIFGKLRANEILLFNKKLTATEAFGAGFVNQVIPDNEFSTKALAFVVDLSKLAKNSLIESKNMIRRLDRDSMLKVNKEEMELLKKRLESGEFMDSVVSFMSKKSKL